MNGLQRFQQAIVDALKDSMHAKVIMPMGTGCTMVLVAAAKTLPETARITFIVPRVLHRLVEREIELSGAKNIEVVTPQLVYLRGHLIPGGDLVMLSNVAFRTGCPTDLAIRDFCKRFDRVWFRPNHSHRTPPTDHQYSVVGITEEEFHNMLVGRSK